MYIDKVAILNFYSFVNIDHPELLIPKILLIAKKKMIKGTIIIANEGFNGGISGLKSDVDLILKELKSLTGSKEINVKVNYASEHPFHKIKIKIKPEIVTMGVRDLDVENFKGDYLDSVSWDEFLEKDNVVVVDTRNDYEVEAGTFKNSINPHTAAFRDFPKWVDDNPNIFKGKTILMCCTGGIRCEKSTAYMKSAGYKNVYHLEGGILRYLEETKNKKGKWRGDCFVFDDRSAVDDDLAPTKID